MTEVLGVQKITTDEYTYSNSGGGYWVDLNSDGKPDFITARQNNDKVFPISELVWFENSGLESEWTEHHLCSCGSEILLMDRLDAYPDEIILLLKTVPPYNDLTIFRVSTKDGSFKA